jgi:hypothetical protein
MGIARSRPCAGILRADCSSPGQGWSRSCSQQIPVITRNPSAIPVTSGREAIAHLQDLWHDCVASSVCALNRTERARYRSTRRSLEGSDSYGRADAAMQHKLCGVRCWGDEWIDRRKVRWARSATSGWTVPLVAWWR